MNVPYSWLQEFLPDAPAPEVLAEVLPQLGLGVEEVRHLPAPPEGVVVARVEEVSSIEGSDHLKACRVTDGSETYSVVCGAPNVRAGMRSALAKPGAALPGAGFTVDKREMLGVTSEGVLCSPKELGLYAYGGGLTEFGEDAELGAELRELWPAETVLELEVTPNRADAFSLLGVARDLAAKLGLELRHPAAHVTLGDPAVDDGLSVKIEDPEGCPRFTLRRTEGVVVAPSPLWLQRRLASLGLRPRNNVVDVTNFVTFELGHPSHAYDLDRVTNDTITVRRAAEGERLVTLGGDELTLTPDDLAITVPDGAGGTVPVGLAGVIGGLDDSVRPETTRVALELAHWDPVSIRKTAKRHGILTDAHHRFERGVDPNLPPLASARAAELIAELSGGEVHPGITDVGGEKPLAQVAFRPARVAFLTTLDVSLEEQRAYLEALGCTVEVRENDWLVTVPSWRFDLAIEEDLIEEVARLHGYDAIGESVPTMHFVPPETDNTHRKLRLLLAGFGLQELITYIFSSDAELARSRAPEAQVRLTHPQGAERSVLRTALYPSLLGAADINRAQPSLAVFEIGRVFLGEERERLGILLRGPRVQGGWLPDQALDFYALKGLLDKLAQTLGVTLSVEPEKVPHLHPGVSAVLHWNGVPAGTLGRLHPEIEAAYDLPDTYLAELELPHISGADITFSDYLRQPHAERDLAVVLPNDAPYSGLEHLVTEAAGERLESVRPFDIYTGQPVPEDRRSVALRLWFRHPERALQDGEVDEFMANVITAVTAAGYAVRDR